MRKIYYGLALLVPVIISCKQRETITREEVIAAIGAFDAGWKNKNARTVDSILSASYIYFTQSGGVFDRKNIVHTAGSADYELDSVLRKQVDIKIEGNTAIVNTTWYGRGTYFGTGFNDYQRCSITVIKLDGKVQILSEHCTPVK